jgi:two-component system sensor histidine kinase MprB
MSLRWRIALGLGLVAALVGALAAVGSYVTTARQLRSAIDETLLTRARNLDPFDRRGPQRGLFLGGACPSPGSLQPAAAAQVVPLAAPDRAVTCIQGGPVLPTSAADLAVAQTAGATPVLRTVTVDGAPYRQLAVPWPRGAVLLVARDLTELDSTLAALRRRLVLVTGLGVAGATLLGWVLAGRIVRPVRRLRDAAEQIALTHDLTTPLPAGGPGEVGSLARSMTSMVGALATSREQQQRLVADASHELRTPLTTLRTNVELLRRAPALPPDERDVVLRDIDTESRELSDLVDELVELATDRTVPGEERQAVDLAELAAAAAATARRRSGRDISVERRGDTTASGYPRMLERAIANLVDNAAKYSPQGTPIEVMVDGRRVEVRDRGSGIGASDEPYVFDRFYRATTARSMPGSGLGLAIVGDVVGRHGGRAWARSSRNAAGVVDGTRAGFELPVSPAP